MFFIGRHQISFSTDVSKQFRILLSEYRAYVPAPIDWNQGRLNGASLDGNATGEIPRLIHMRFLIRNARCQLKCRKRDRSNVRIGNIWFVGSLQAGASFLLISLIRGCSCHATKPRTTYIYSCVAYYVDYLLDYRTKHL